MATTSLAGVTLLVVDDDPHVRGLYVTVLRQAGASVMSTGVASEAVGLIELQPPDVVVTDLRMPEHDGIWLLRELKARSPGLPVILISGHVEEFHRDKLLELGFANVELSSEVVDEGERRRTLLGEVEQSTPKPRWQPGERYAAHVEGYHHQGGGAGR